MLKVCKKSNVEYDLAYLNVYDETYVKSVLSSLNKNLSNARYKENAFDVIFKIINISSSSIIKENYNTWVKFALNYHPNEEITNFHYKFIGKLLSLCASNQDFHRTIVTNHLSKIIDTCLSTPVKSSTSLSSLKCLEKCMKIFSKSSIPYKKRIDGFLESFLDSSVNTSVLKKAAKCMLFSNQLGSSGTNASTHIKNCTNYLNTLVKSLHNLYEECFNEIEEFQNYTIEIENAFLFKLLPGIEENERTEILFRRINNLTLFLTVAIQSSFPVKKSFSPTLLIRIIERGLSVHEHFVKNNKDKNIFAEQLIEHQIKLLDLLKVFITCLESNIIRFSSIKILVYKLKQIKSCNCFDTNIMFNTKIYETIQHSILNNEQLDKQAHETILQYIYKDIYHERSSIVLKVTNNKYSKAKNKPFSENTNNSLNCSKDDVNFKLQETKLNTCVAALNTLATLFKKVEWNINTRIIDTFYKTITQILLDLSFNVKYFPYTNEECTLSLYKVFTAILHQYYSINLAVATNILNIGESSNNINISNVCAEGLETISKITQPINYPFIFNQEENREDTELTEFTPITCSEFMNSHAETYEDPGKIVEINKINENVSSKENEPKLNSFPPDINISLVDETNSSSIKLGFEKSDSTNEALSENPNIEEEKSLSSNEIALKNPKIDKERIVWSDEVPSKKLKIDEEESLALSETPSKKLKIAEEESLAPSESPLPNQEVDEEMLNSFNDEIIVEDIINK